MGSLPASDDRLLYPTARRDDSVADNYHGVTVRDPYRWLEDGDSEETKEFVEEQNKLMESVLSKCETRQKLSEKLTEVYDFPRYDAPFRAGDHYFYFHNSGLQPQRVLYIQDNVDGEAEVLVDPNTFSEDGTVALNGFQVSVDAKYIAYGITHSGSDWVTIKLMQIEDKIMLPDALFWVKFSGISWTHDSKGFFYSRYPAPVGTETNANLNHQLYYHFVGTDQSEDILCWSDPHNPKHRHSASVTEDGKYVLLYTFKDCNPVNMLYYCDDVVTALRNGLNGFPFVKLVGTFDAVYDYVANDGTVFTFHTTKDAPRYKLARVDVRDPSCWRDVVGEDDMDVLQSAVAVNRKQVLVSYLSDVKSVLQLRDLETGRLLQRLPLGIGTVYSISARRKDSIAFVGFTSFVVPGIIYTCDLQSDVPQMKILREIVVPGFDKSHFHVTQVFYPSKDGTEIPMFIVGRKGMRVDGSHPCLLYGYGGFNTSLTPSFNVSRSVIARHLGVVLCVANIRGGGEYGEEWHRAGILSKKQNVFDDFISAAEHLISAGYTSPAKLCIEGGSNGGLLVGACINQRPDLFACALPRVGVMDMLRFHKFTIGHAWTSDFGCSDNEEEFRWLLKYSPLHNVRRPWGNISSQYPATMVLTADHDDRVVPLHSLKFLATMQHVLCTSVGKASPQTNPIVGRIERKAGHGAGKPTRKLIAEAADKYSFMAKMVGASWMD
ncbi:prolyl oligopeptidase [Salvia divinorum]|uniref:Prolyl endopeptidase n=1 Tax=Salvia divinorum TaxID=28513 RepID=A0ABD1H7R2_SALDI